MFFPYWDVVLSFKLEPRKQLTKRFLLLLLPLSVQIMAKKKKGVKYLVVDAFTDSAFKGNPAAVCFLNNEIRDDAWLQSLAAEFNISQSSFLTPITGFEARFGEEREALEVMPAPEVTPTPTPATPLPPPASMETILARLALQEAAQKAAVDQITAIAKILAPIAANAEASTAQYRRHLFATERTTNVAPARNNNDQSADNVEFVTRSGVLTAKRVDDGEAKGGSFLIELNFPVVPTCDINLSDASSSMITKALNGATILDIKATATNNILVVLPSLESVTELQPIMDDILNCPCDGIIVTAAGSPGTAYDFHSRYFAPKLGVDEASRRSGTLEIYLDKEKQRVLLRGKAVTVMEGHVLV
ncbi:hypothetical protein YC2023_017973 [Brassica napus]